MNRSNFAWSREELVLALDFYFRFNPLHISANNPKINTLCNDINKVNDLKYQLGLADQQVVRNSSAAYMKLCNFLRLDPTYTGKGLEKGSRLEKEVWDQYSEDKAYLSSIANSIRSSVATRKEWSNYVYHISQSGMKTEVREGTLLFTLHRSYERNPTLVKNKKKDALQKYGIMKCEICGFCFRDFYGEIGEGFIECHHLVPLSSYGDKKTTSIDDLMLVCSNCHRMLHARMGEVGAEQLREQVRLRGGYTNTSRAKQVDGKDKE